MKNVVLVPPGAHGLFAPLRVFILKRSRGGAFVYLLGYAKKYDRR